MISVIIPVYNGEKYIEHAMKSVIFQTYNDVELVVVNDGSTDGTIDIINNVWEKYKPKGEIISITNGGLANARNVGIGLAKGEFICNLDADDYLEKDVFEKIFCMHDNTSFDICYYGYNEVSEGGSYIKTYKDDFSYLDNLFGEDALTAKLTRAIWICQGNAIYRKSIIDKYNIYNIKGINQGEDFYFICLMLAYSFKVRCIPYAGVNIRTIETSMMHQKYNESFKQSIIAAKNVYNRLSSDEKYRDRGRILNLVRIHIMEQICHVCKKMILSHDFNNRNLVKSIKKLTNDEFTGLNQLKKYMSLKKYIEFVVASKMPYMYIYMTRLYKNSRI